MPRIKKLDKNASDAVDQYKALMKKYKIENPVKWEKATTVKEFVNNTMTEYEYKISLLKGKEVKK